MINPEGSDLVVTKVPTAILMRLKVTQEKRHQSGKFDHVGAAQQLTCDRDAFFAQVDDETLDRLETLFTMLSASS
ncbi:hypothetical protein ACFV30_40450 [Streptomyces sp. NPDC059752]|uniref:hypothetical protein n=1 Tax=unclassified Streptomyces TaxID=2593676 RepID=UPI00364EB938